MSEVQKEAGVEMQRQDLGDSSARSGEAPIEGSARKIRMVPGVEPRAETGPMQFGDDWPGVFIRGDNAFMYTGALRRAADAVGGIDAICAMLVRDLADTFAGSDLTGLSDAPSRRSADTEGTGQISPESAPVPAPESNLDLLLLLQAAQALEKLVEWDRARNFIVPYKLRDPIHAVLAGLRQRIGPAHPLADSRSNEP